MPVNIHLLRDEAYRLILEMIFSGEITADEPLSERKLAERLGMGRTPVREALRALARDGVVETQLARGTFVRKLSPEDVREVYEVRQAIEGMAAWLAARHGPTPAMREFAGKMRQAQAEVAKYSTTEVDQLGTEFHSEIFTAAGNALLLKAFEPLRLRFQLAFGLPRHQDTGALQDSLKEHLAIFDAIENRDCSSAQRAMHEHLAHGLEVRLASLGLVDKDARKETRQVG